MRGIQGWEWIIILAVLLLMFGAKKLPGLARSLGESAKEFKKGIAAGSTEEEVGEPNEKISGLARSLGASAKEFREGIEAGATEEEAGEPDQT